MLPDDFAFLQPGVAPHPSQLDLLERIAEALERLVEVLNGRGVKYIHGEVRDLEKKP